MPAGAALQRPNGDREKAAIGYMVKLDDAGLTAGHLRGGSDRSVNGCNRKGDEAYSFPGTGNGGESIHIRS